MGRGQSRRWRDSRDTLPARRRRRAARRRDSPASKEYAPFEVDAGSATRGIQARLVGGLLAAMLFLGCMLSVVFAPAITLGSVLAVSVGICSLGLSLSLIMSARKEEIVHQVAGELMQDLERHRERPSLGDEDGTVRGLPDHSGDLYAGAVEQWSWDGDEYTRPRR